MTESMAVGLVVSVQGCTGQSKKEGHANNVIQVLWQWGGTVSRN